MNKLNSFRKTEPTPLVSLFAVITTLLAGVFIYQRFFGSPFIDFGPIMLWLAIAIPAGIFGAIFLHFRASARTEQFARQVQAGVAELETHPRLSEDSRRAAQPKLNRPFPDKDPFENL